CGFAFGESASDAANSPFPSVVFQTDKHAAEMRLSGRVLLYLSKDVTMFRRFSLLAAGLGISAAAGLVMLANTSAQPPKREPTRTTETAPVKRDDPVTNESATRTQLPIGQVVLFSSGVGYFQREGQVEGNTRVDLSFPVTDINDLIKSMVLRDLDG